MLDKFKAKHPTNASFEEKLAKYSKMATEIWAQVQWLLPCECLHREDGCCKCAALTYAVMQNVLVPVLVRVTGRIQSWVPHDSMCTCPCDLMCNNLRLEPPLTTTMCGQE